MRNYLLFLFSFFSLPVFAAVLNVTNYGAIGDCVQLHVSCTGGSPTIVTTNSLGSGAVGKHLELFGAGALGSYGFPSAYPTTEVTNHQDLIVTISAVSGFNVTVFPSPNFTTNCLATFGTNNLGPFQHVIDLAANGDTIQIPAGNFLILPPGVINTNYQMTTYADASPPLILSKGGLNFVGAGTNDTILTACGAWQNKTNIGGTVGDTQITGDTNMNGLRGSLLYIFGPVTNDGPVIFGGIVFDGGVSSGRTDFDYSPVMPANGNGWDVTHHAIVIAGTAPIQQSILITNCVFRHWRGEVVIGVVPLTDGFVTVSNCVFLDGNASAINFSFSHDYNNNYFKTFKTAMELYRGYMTSSSYFRNSVLDDIVGITGGGIGIVIGGEEVGHTASKYTISNVNIIASSGSGIFLNPIQNCDILNNTLPTGINFGSAGYQGSTNSWNVLIQGNNFSNAYVAIGINAAIGAAELHNCSIVDNVGYYPGLQSQFINGIGWSTNVTLNNNTAYGYTFGTYGASLQGQYFIDSTNNIFPSYQTVVYNPTNRIISYKQGMRWQLDAGANWFLENSSPERIPIGAQLFVYNATGSSSSLQNLSGGATVSSSSGETNLLFWNSISEIWQTNPSPTRVTGGFLGRARL